MRLTLSVVILTLGERYVTRILLLAKLDSMRVRHVITNELGGEEQTVKSRHIAFALVVKRPKAFLFCDIS